MSEKTMRSARASRENPARRVQAPQSVQSRGNQRPAPKKKKKLKFFDIGLGLDMPFCLLVLVLLTVGIIMMFSASYPIAYAETGDSYYYLKRQVIFAAIGIGAMIGLSFVNYRIFYRFAKLLLAISYGALVLVLFLLQSLFAHHCFGLLKLFDQHHFFVRNPYHNIY